ncbi:MAG: hypothetical protein ABIL89_03050 [candidate division WOR-3 bacterium]
MKYRIFVPIHIATQKILTDWLGFIDGFLNELAVARHNPLRAIEFRKRIDKLADDVNLNGRSIKKEMKKLLALYEKAQQDKTIEEIVKNVNLKADVKQTTYGMTKYYYLSLIYESDKVHPFIFHKALMLTNQSASFFSLALFSRFEDTSAYNKYKSYKIRCEYNLTTQRDIIGPKSGSNEKILKEALIGQHIALPPYIYDLKENISILKKEFKRFGTKLTAIIQDITFYIRFPYVEGTINEETLDGDIELIPFVPPFYKKDNHPQLVFKTDYILPQKIEISSLQSNNKGMKEKLKEKQEKQQEQTKTQEIEQKKMDLTIPLLVAGGLVLWKIMK